MSSQRTIPKSPPDDPGLDQRRLFALGIEHVRRLARRVWTDHNVHDPGVTILELLCYALTDLGYRASLPVEDLLASGDTRANFPPPAELLSARPLTHADYRKLLIDVPDVTNAWLRPAPRALYVDLLTETIVRERPARTTGVREVTVRGLYEVTVELANGVGDDDRAAALASARSVLHQNRGLCEDFLDPIRVVASQGFVVCAEVELAIDADPTGTAARILFDVQQHLTPPIHRYTLAEMLERERPGGGRYAVEEVFDGPLLRHGFIDGEELARADLRESVRLSDVISVVMDVPGVLAVRDIVVNALGVGDDAGSTVPLADRWSVPVAAHHQPVLDPDRCRLVLYKRNMPVTPARAEVTARYAAMMTRERRRDPVPHGLAPPTGARHDLRGYYSFQNHFPEVYGVGEAGLPADATDARKAQALQLKAYLLFFDQVMANYCAQLASLNDLLDPASESPRTYAYQPVDTLLDHGRLYREADIAAAIARDIEPTSVHQRRRERFLDHLIARFAEQFRQYEAVMAALTGHELEETLRLKREFLASYPSVSAARGLGFDHAPAAPGRLWDTDNVTGLERRVAALLGIRDFTRRDLGEGDAEGLFVLENILLRVDSFEPPLLPVCVDAGCEGCADDDPYSYRVHVLLPEYAGRFAQMDFRRYAEEVIREETPAHVLPQVCWISREDMRRVAGAYRAWLEGRAAGTNGERHQRLDALVDALKAAKSVYPSAHLTACEPGRETPVHFILGTHRLGSDRNG